MPSPFPGMDPYIEAPHLWNDFHISMIVAMRDALNAVLPPRYAASADVHVWSVDPQSETSVLLGKPDVPMPREPRATGGWRLGCGTPTRRRRSAFECGGDVRGSFCGFTKPGAVAW